MKNNRKGSSDGGMKFAGGRKGTLIADHPNLETTRGANLQVQDSMQFTEPAVRQDETLTAEQQTELTQLRVRWNGDGVLQRPELQAASPMVQRQFVADLLAATRSTGDQQEIAGTLTINHSCAAGFEQADGGPQAVRDEDSVVPPAQP
jgi:hypothetical protein